MVVTKVLNTSKATPFLLFIGKERTTVVVAKLSKTPQAHHFLLFIGKERTTMAASWAAQREHFIIMSAQSTTCLSALQLYDLVGSSVLLHTPECSQYHPLAQSPVISAFPRTKLQIPWTNYPFLSITLSLSTVSNLWEIFLFLHIFSSVPLSWGTCVFDTLSLCNNVKCYSLRWLVTLCVP